MTQSALTQRLIREGCTPKAPLTDAQVLLERIAWASASGTPAAARRQVLAECETFIRAGLASELTSPGRAA